MERIVNFTNSVTDNFNDQLDTMYKDLYDPNINKSLKLSKIKEHMHKKISTDYRNYNPHVNGFYYIHMVPGTWFSDYEKLTKVKELVDNTGSTSDTFNEFSSFDETMKTTMVNNFGMVATDIDMPQINIEYESVSGKSRNLNFASKMQYTGDFSINFLENYEASVFKYHEAWMKYIDAFRKGFIKNDISTNTDAETFINIPYFSAVWVVIFEPFTTNISGLVKIMGVAPLNLPFKQVLGDRSKNGLTIINQNYKSNDMVYQFYEKTKDGVTGDEVHADDDFMKEFINDINIITK